MRRIMPHAVSPRRRVDSRAAPFAALAALVAAAALLVACTSSSGDGAPPTFTIPPSSGVPECGSGSIAEFGRGLHRGASEAVQSEAAQATGLPDAVRSAMQNPTFDHSSFGLLVQDATTGDNVADLRSQEIFESGSTAKLFAAAAMLDTYGPDATFRTPIYRTGDGTGGAVRGDLVLVGAGGQNLGGRGVLDGQIQYEPIDHTYAGIPGAAETPGDPLAGIKKLAADVKAAGITSVGDVVVDDRLFDVEQTWEQHPISSIVVNDNVIDVLSTPGEVGQPATLDWRPQVSGWTVRSEVSTGAPGSEPAAQVSLEAPGQLVVTGSVPAGGSPALASYPLPDPASFARSALIDELTKAGVNVNAPPTGANPVAQLPARESYLPADQVAALVSAPLSETVTMVLKTSHNPGANRSPACSRSDRTARRAWPPNTRRRPRPASARRWSTCSTAPAARLPDSPRPPEFSSSTGCQARAGVRS